MIKDVVRKAGCSVNTVSRALNGKPEIIPTTKGKILELQLSLLTGSVDLLEVSVQTKRALESSWPVLVTLLGETEKVEIQLKGGGKNRKEVDGDGLSESSKSN